MGCFGYIIVINQHEGDKQGDDDDDDDDNFKTYDMESNLHVPSYLLHGTEFLLWILVDLCWFHFNIAFLRT